MTAALPAALPKLAPPATPVVEIDSDTSIERGAEAQVIRDWGLSEKRPPRRRMLKVAAALLLLTAAGGGYAVYTQMFADSDDSELAKGEDDLAPPEATNDLDGAGESDDADPFGDAPAVNPGTRSRLAANAEPRRIDTAEDATPIVPRGAANGRVRNLPRSRDVAFDDDEPEDVDADRQPDELSDAELDEGPDASRNTPRTRSLSDRSLGDRARREGTLSSNARNSGRSSSAGPRIADDDDESQPSMGVPADDPLDGYRVADKPGTAMGRGGSSRPAISIVEAQDESLSEEKLEGYIAEDMNTHRAVSKTLVVRANKAAARRGSATGSEAFAEEPAEDEISGSGERFARPGTGRGASNGTVRRGTTLPPTGDGMEPVSDTYRVSPEDNFWKISRKLYGTARYYQALMRHNEDRVPDPQKLRPGTQILTPPAAVLEENYPDLIERVAPATPSASRGPGRTGLHPAFERPLDGPVDRPVDRRDDASDTRPGPSNGAATGYFYSPSGEPLYRIGHDDTLGSIAQRHLGRASRWQEIYGLNQDVLQSPDNLTLGTVIRLPSDASRIGLAPESDRRR
jgi:nucleoid-associated protein YgaU